MAGPAQDGGPSYELQFPVPPPEGGEDLTLEDHFIRQMEMTPTGAQVRIAQTVISRMRIAQAIVDAYQRGVDVPGRAPPSVQPGARHGAPALQPSTGSRDRLR